MSAAKPTKVQYAWKYADTAMDDFAKQLLRWLDYATDNNAGLTGVQNPFSLKDIPFRADCPGIDVFAIGISATGIHETPGFWTSTITLTIKEAGGIDASQTSFEVLAPAKVADLAEGDHLEGPSGEIMRIEGISTGSPNWTLTVERGAHGTDPAGVAYDGTLTLLAPRVGMRRIVLVGDTAPLDPPVMNTPNGIGDGILLTWTHSYTTADLLRLKGWRIYYSITAAIDKEDSGTYNGYIEIEGIDRQTIFNPMESGFVNVDQTFYFAMTALTKKLLESDLSNEVSGKVSGTIGPNPNGPTAPTVSVEVNGSYRLKVEAKKPTGTDSYLGVMNVKKATIEVYYAAAGLGNPTTGTPDGNQTLIGSYEDTSSPYSVEIGVSGYGYKDYWARAKFTDGNDEESDWGLSSVFELNSENNTIDTSTPTGVYVQMLVDTGNPFQAQTSYYANVAATGNEDSADRCQIAFRVDGVGTFQAGEDTPFLGATAPESTPKTSGYPGINHVWLSWDHAWEVTARVRNAYGWSDWMTPEEITLTKELNTTDDDVCDLAGFGAWTKDNPPPGGWTTELKEPSGQQVVVQFFLPDDDSSSVWSLAVGGTASASFPTETVLYDQDDGAAVAVPGTLQATITFTSYSPALNEFAGKIFRKGLAEGKNTDDNLQGLVISSNTAGNPCTLTFTGAERIRNLDPAGSVDNWQIINKAIWDLLDFYEVIEVYPDRLGTVAPKTFNVKTNATGMKLFGQAHNVWGIGAKRYSDATATGTATAASATYKSIGGIDTPDLKPGAVDGTIIDQVLSPIAHSVVFTATSNRAFSWSSGSVNFSDGTSQSINSGSSGDKTTNKTYFVCMTPGSGTLTVTDAGSVALNGKVIVAVVFTFSDANEYVSIVPICGSGLNISAKSIVCEYLSSISAAFGEMTSGTITGALIRTAASGIRIELDSTNGLRNIDSGGTTRVKMPADASKLIFYAAENVTSRYPTAGHIEFNGAWTLSDSGFVPASADSGTFNIGFGSWGTTKLFENIRLNASAEIEAYVGYGKSSKCYLKINQTTVELRQVLGTTATFALNFSNVVLSTAGLLQVKDDLAIGLGETGQYSYLYAFVTGSGDPGIRYDRTNSKWQFSNNGSSWTDM